MEEKKPPKENSEFVKKALATVQAMERFGSATQRIAKAIDKLLDDDVLLRIAEALEELSAEKPLHQIAKTLEDALGYFSRTVPPEVKEEINNPTVPKTAEPPPNPKKP